MTGSIGRAAGLAARPFRWPSTRLSTTALILWGVGAALAIGLAAGNPTTETALRGVFFCVVTVMTLALKRPFPAFLGIAFSLVMLIVVPVTLDWGLKYFLTAVALLAPLSALGIVLAWPGLSQTSLTTQLENVYGFLAFVGVVSFAILGMLYKVVPFLVWYASYSKSIGRHKVPALADLYSPALQAAGYWLFLAGLVLTSVATALGHEGCVSTGGVVLLASVALFVVNMGKVLVHLVRPRIEPLESNRSAALLAAR